MADVPGSMGAMEIRAENLSYAYGGSAPVLRGVELVVRSPEVLCILGVNGTGKSTLLQCLAGLFRPASGRVFYNGREASTFSRREIGRLFAYIPQMHASTFPFAVLDVVLMGRTAHLSYLGTPGRRDREAALEAMDFLGIAHLARRVYTGLSGGERQMVILAAALAQRPRMMLLDEPTSHLDFGRQHRLLAVLSQLARSGVGIVMTTHFPDHALAVGGKVAVLRDGVIAEYGPPAEVINAESMRALYGIPVTMVDTPRGRRCLAGV